MDQSRAQVDRMDHYGAGRGRLWTAGKRTLVFPSERIVGWLDWRGSWKPETGPILATAQVEVPDDPSLALTVYPIMAVVRHGDAWSKKFSSEPVDLDFLTRLPGDAVTALVLCPPFIPESFSAIVHLAPGLRRLSLNSTMLTDDALPAVTASNRAHRSWDFG